MSEDPNIKQTLTSRSSLERELHLKQLQINRILNITQAINNNLSTEDLFKMYNSFLSWEMDVKKMALFIKEDGTFKCSTHIGIAASLAEIDINDQLPKYDRLKNINEVDHPFISEFEIVIPVRHKNMPIAYAFIGGCSENEDIYNKVQFIITITNIIAVAIENKRLFKRQIEQERLNREMELASEMQKMLVPNSLPNLPKYELAAIYKPQIGVGGDYYDFLQLDDERIMFCVADISGKGLAAALLMANFQANLRILIRQHSDLRKFIAALNSAVFEITNGEKYITFFIGVYNINTRVLDYMNAGHVPPYLVSSKGVKMLQKGCTILGNFEELPFIESDQVKVDKNSMVITFTDGLTDLKNEAGDYFDEDILAAFIDLHIKPRTTAKAFNERLMKRLEAFRGKRGFPDDIAVLSCKIK